jgi:hypothetical protein
MPSTLVELIVLDPSVAVSAFGDPPPLPARPDVPVRSAGALEEMPLPAEPVALPAVVPSCGLTVEGGSTVVDVPPLPVAAEPAPAAPEVPAAPLPEAPVPAPPEVPWPEAAELPVTPPALLPPPALPPPAPELPLDCAMAGDAARIASEAARARRVVRMGLLLLTCCPPGKSAPSADVVSVKLPGVAPVPRECRAGEQGPVSAAERSGRGRRGCRG